MKTLIIGANGKIGRHLCRKLEKSKEHKPTAFIRNEEQRSFFEKMGVATLVEDLEKREVNLENAVAGFDAVVFTAGSGADTGYDKTLEVDLYGAVKAIEAAEKKGTKRFVMVSAAHSGNPENWPENMRAYYIAKHLADRELKRSQLDYTIFRPVNLTDDEESKGLKIASEPSPLNPEIPRVAVAETIVQLLANEKSYDKILEMSEGDMEITEAIDQFVQNS